MYKQHCFHVFFCCLLYFTLFINFLHAYLFIEYSKITFLEEIDPKKFYGSKMNDIERLEKKLQTEFDTFCLTKKPVLWPGMAFNLSVPGNFVN